MATDPYYTSSKYLEECRRKYYDYLPQHWEDFGMIVRRHKIDLATATLAGNLLEFFLTLPYSLQLHELDWTNDHGINFYWEYDNVFFGIDVKGGRAAAWWNIGNSSTPQYNDCPITLATVKESQFFKELLRCDLRHPYSWRIDNGLERALKRLHSK